MKTIQGNSIFITLLLSAIIFSCVPQKKYIALRNRTNRLSRDSVNFYSQLLGLKGTISKLEMEREMTNSKLKKSRGELLQAKETLNTNAETIAKQQKRLIELRQLIEQQKQTTETLRNSIAAALGSFNADQLTVSLKNGKVYVSISEKLLFVSGSADVRIEGKNALSSLAKALNQNADININVEGDADSIPIAKKFMDNWVLSVARSTAIACILIKDYHATPVRIISSSRSQFLPLADNASPESRAKNRRTEIILEPRLDKIMELVDNQNNSTDTTTH
ncbi:MAG: OmpA family protein [Phycisphaerales bacterium]|nr:OmpA family protein [Phycisphaerales bacterium]